MKKKFRFLLLPGMVALSFLYYSFQFLSTTFTFTPTQNPLRVPFTNSLPTFSYSRIDTPFYKIFYSLGDGRFWMGTLADFRNKAFYYDSNKQSAVGNDQKSFVEYLAAYDDTVDPNRIAASAPPSVSGGTTGIPTGEELKVTMQPEEAVKLQSTCSPSNGDIITFIITRKIPVPATLPIPTPVYENADGEFKYDASVLHYEGCNHFGNMSTASPSNNDHVSTLMVDGIQHNVGNIKWTYNPLNSTSIFDQQNIFLYFQAKTDNFIKHGGGYIVPSVVLYSKVHAPSGGADEDIIVDTDEMTGQAIVDTHDPNHKYAPKELSIFDQYIDFTIDCQNEGDTVTSSVWIEESLDALLDYSYVPDVINYSGCPTMPIVSAIAPIADRKYKIDFGALHLHGLREDGLGRKFTEADTKASVTIHCKIQNGLPAWASSAILNKSRIKFNCNPFYDTNLAKSIIMCTEGVSVLKDSTLVFPDTIARNTFLTGLPNYLDNSLGFGTGSLYKWYPTSGMSNPFNINPGFNTQARGTYTLVVSKCDLVAKINYLAYFTIRITNPLEITIDKCSRPGFLIATVNGYTGTNPSTDLQWHRCGSHGKTYTSQVVEGKTTYYFGVTDLSTGNDTEIIYKPGGRPCNSIFDWVTVNAYLIAAIVIAALFITRFFIANKNK